MKSVAVQLDKPHEDVANRIDMGENFEETQLSQETEGRGNQLIVVGGMQCLSVGSFDNIGGGEFCGLDKQVSLSSGGIVRRIDPPNKGYWFDDGSLLRRSRSMGQMKDINDNDSVDSKSNSLEVGPLDFTDKLRPR
ncbi:unnamed protein product, partial [Ilex paraguariensis]